MRKIHKKILKDQLFASLKIEVIKYLNGISNRYVSVSIPKYSENFLIKDLINQVAEETEVGFAYMEECIKNLSLIEALKRKNDFLKKEI